MVLMGLGLPSVHLRRYVLVSAFYATRRRTNAFEFWFWKLFPFLRREGEKRVKVLCLLRYVCIYIYRACKWTSSDRNHALSLLIYRSLIYLSIYIYILMTVLLFNTHRDRIRHWSSARWIRLGIRGSYFLDDFTSRRVLGRVFDKEDRGRASSRD